LRGRHWDIVVLQEQSRIPSQPIKRKTHMVPSVMQLARESRAVGAMPVIYQTWGYRDGDERRIYDDFFAMNKRLREGCHAAARVEGLPIVRVGDAWESEMAKGRGTRLFMPDGLHPSRDGVRLNAQVFYNAFLPEIVTSDQMDKVSAKGYSFGYIGSVILFILNLSIQTLYLNGLSHQSLPL
jgi:hypothetical protein